ncbi:PAS domain S-box protein [Aureimonas fodinaquatilis]|uniref:Blue-light-activated histidine kinase n=2 Tax=Aureimonas fodinaquatilis TaxID=2565783 RepID=A0A5B0DXX9_9HYPH|nr:PAS domain S-box protein [Aureimonas fodinaquatilis]
MILPAHSRIVLFWGPEFVTFYNDAYGPTIGVKHPGALGRPARENWSERWNDDLGPLLEKVRETGETFSCKGRPFYTERHGYPETVYFDLSYSAVRDEAGAIQGVLCLVNETTEWVLAQAALEENEQQLAAIISQASGGIAVADLTGQMTLVNRRFCEIVGYSEAELLQMNMQDITYDADLHENQILFSRLIDGEGDFFIEKRYVRKDGSLVWVGNSVGLIRDEQGVPEKALAVVADISDRKRAEDEGRRLASIISSSQEAILATDLEMIITSWNTGAEKLYGYDAEEVIGQKLSILVPADRSGEEADTIDCMRRDEFLAPFDTQRVRKDNTIVDVALTVSPIKDEHGVVTGASIIARDVTERKHAERLQRVIAQEMQHRVKNIFATVQAIARQTFSGSSDVAASIQAFNGRIMAMTKAHDLLHSETWDGADLWAVIRQATAPYDADQFEISGPNVRLSPRAALALSLALHELATNAAKYGALSASSGRVSIEWSIAEYADPILHFWWKESGGPEVFPPTRQGFGSKLIQNVLAAELRGDVTVSHNREGLEFAVTAPLEISWDS